MTLLTEQLSGTWTADPSHSAVGFSVRHAGISKVKGRFTDFQATVSHEGERVAVNATIETGSFDSGSADRDAHVRSADFLDVENYPTLTFEGYLVEEADGPKLVGDLTIHGVTKNVTLDVEFNGTAVDPFGNTRAGVEASTVISRKDFGLTWNAAIEAGGVLVSDKVNIVLDLSFIKNAETV